MKTIKNITLLSLAILASFLFARCSDDDPVAPSLFTVSGTVTYPDFTGTTQNAIGAIVYLVENTTTASTNYNFSAVVDASGNYSFANLAAGDYFMFANYNTENGNVAGRIDGVNFDSGEGFLFSVTDADVSQVIGLETIDQTTSFIVDTRSTGDWGFDGSHSVVDFEFPYDASNAPFGGKFDDFDIEVYFNTSDLANGSIEASIDLLSINTSSRGGRDSFFDDVLVDWDYGCLQGTLGVAVDAVTNLPDETTRYATFSASGFEAYGDGYKATGTFTLNGNSNQETLFFRFIEGYEGTTFSGAERRFSSFEGLIEFAALGDYGIDSSHLLEGMVTVNISNQVTFDL